MCSKKQFVTAPRVKRKLTCFERAGLSLCHKYLWALEAAEKA
jgi:hypothetical protein